MITSIEMCRGGRNGAYHANKRTRVQMPPEPT